MEVINKIEAKMKKRNVNLVPNKKFKQSIIGLIPNSWNVLTILNSVNIYARIGWHGLTTSEYLTSGDFILITGKDFDDGRISWNTCFFVEAERYEKDKNIQVQINDVLITKDGTIGKIVYIDQLPQKATLNSGVFTLRPKDNLFVPLYFYYILRSSYFDSFIRMLKAGSTISHLYQKDIVNFNFPSPPLPEQKAIATVLSDVDALIDALDALIEKKRNIKQGVMQKLLTGKRRLAGFSGKWEVRNIEDIAEVKGGKRLPKGKELISNETGQPYIRVTDMYQGGIHLNDLKYVPINLIPTIQNYKIFKDDLFISVAGTLGIVGKIPECLDGANLTENANRLTKIKCNKDFLLYILMSPIIQIPILNTQTVGAQPKLALTRIQKFQIPYPSLEEQKAIAQVLSDINSEIENLEQQRNKVKLMKQGMMQELLTGKTRLI